MKARFIIQIFLSLCVLAFGAFALYEYYQTKEETQKKEELALFLPNIEFSQLKDLKLDQQNNKLSAVKKEKEWFLIEPVKDLMDEEELSRWFNAVKSQKVQKIEAENIDWKNYYLDSAPLVELELAEGKKITFSVSEKSSFDGKYFIKKEGELFLGESSFFSEINTKNLDDFRSKKLLPSLSHATRIQFKGKYNYQLNWKNQEWSLEGRDSKSLPLDSAQLDAFWTDISSMKALSILSSASSFNLKKRGLNKAQQTLNITYGDKEFVLKLSSFKEDKAFVSVSHRDYIFEVSKETAEKILLAKKEIYNHNFPFNYNISSSAYVEKHAGKNSFVITKEGENWKVTEAKHVHTQEEHEALKKDKSADTQQEAMAEKKDELVDSKKETKIEKKDKLVDSKKETEHSKAKDKLVDSKKVEELLDRIKELRGEKYKASSNKSALRSIVIKDSKEELIFELKEISQTQKMSWVQTNLWTESIAVPKDLISDIFNLDIFVKKETKAEVPKTK